MRILVRSLASLVTAAAAYYFIFWFGGALLLDRVPERFYWVTLVLSLGIALLAEWYVWKHTRQRPVGLVEPMLLGALVVGGIAFCAGFFGPLIITPKANQGPMLGLFITGPLGFLIGAVAGVIYGLRHQHGPPNQRLERP